MKVKRILAAILLGLFLIASPVCAMEGMYNPLNGSFEIDPTANASDAWAVAGVFLALLTLAAMIYWLCRRGRHAPAAEEAAAPRTRQERIARRLCDILRLPPGTRLSEYAHPYLLIPGKRHRRYIDRTYAPLTFHKLARFVILPLNVIVSASPLIRYATGNMNRLPEIFTRYESMAVVITPLALIAFVALLRWRRVGVWCFLAIYWFSAAYYLYAFVEVCASTLAGGYGLGTMFLDIAKAIICLTINIPFALFLPNLAGLFLMWDNLFIFPIPLIIAVALTIYYVKRAPLFSPRYRDIQDALTAPPSQEEAARLAAAPDVEGESESGDAVWKATLLARLTRVMRLPADTELDEDVFPYLLIPGKRLIRYVDRKHAARKFHGYMRAAVIPWFIVLTALVIMLRATGVGLPPKLRPSVVNFALESVNLVLLSIAFFGFMRWRKVGLACCLLVIWFVTAWSTSYLVYQFVKGSPDLDLMIGEILGFLVGSVPVSVYYTKRALLFSPRYREIEEALRG